MTEWTPHAWWSRFRAMPNESIVKTLIVATATCLVCSSLVSTTAVLLRPLQRENRDRERRHRIVELIAKQPGLGAMVEQLDPRSVEAKVVVLADGSWAEWIDGQSFDARKAAQDPLQSVALPPERDPAGIGRLAKHATVYVVREESRIRLIILPVHGKGYASTIYGFVALENDGNTIAGLSFYEHEETPGVGAEIENAAWLAQWVGKKVRDGKQQLRIGVAKGEVTPNSPEAPYTVDGLSGATRTCDGVTRMLRFWLGDDGYGPFLRRLRS